VNGDWGEALMRGDEEGVEMILVDIDHPIIFFPVTSH
jgi:hypothetical protein